MKIGLKYIFYMLVIMVGDLSSAREARAWSDAEIRSTIEATLKVRHPDETKDWWRSLGVNTPSIIISIFNDESNTYHKIRLVDALAWFDDAAAVEFLKKQATHQDNRVLRRAAIRSIGVSQGLKEKDFLKQSLDSSDPHTRLMVAKLLSGLKEPAAERIVHDFLKTEKTEWVSTSVKHSKVEKGNRLSIEGKRKY